MRHIAGFKRHLDREGTVKAASYTPRPRQSLRARIPRALHTPRLARQPQVSSRGADSSAACPAYVKQGCEETCPREAKTDTRAAFLRRAARRSAGPTARTTLGGAKNAAAQNSDNRRSADYGKRGIQALALGQPCIGTHSHDPSRG